MAIITFYASFLLLIGFFAVKLFEEYNEKKHALSEMIGRGDEYFHGVITKTKATASKIKFKNFQKLVFIIASFTKRELIYLKRRFDSKQPKFFLKPDNKPDIHSKGAVSSFLKNVSDYKNSIGRKK